MRTNLLESLRRNIYEANVLTDREANNNYNASHNNAMDYSSYKILSSPLQNIRLEPIRPRDRVRQSCRSIA